MNEEDRKTYEVMGCVRGFLNSKSMQNLAKHDPDFEWWFQLLAKKIAEVDKARGEQ